MKFAHLVSAVAFAALAAKAEAHSLGSPDLQKLETTGVVRVQCEDPCYSHSRWRSHYRWSSQGAPYWHDRWRSHYRWSSYGGYWHRRDWSHYRWGSYHRLWRGCDHCGWDE